MIPSRGQGLWGRWRKLCFAAGCAGTLAAQSLDADLLFSCSFEGACAADFARGLPAVRTHGTVSLVEGHSGQAAALDRGYLSYEAAANINAQEGTVCFWFKTRWEPAAAGDHYFFCWAADQSRAEVNSVSVFFLGGPKELRLLFRTSAAGAYSIMQASPAWNRETWHHFAMVWRAPRLAAFVDGRLLAETALSVALGEPPARFFLGARSDGACLAHATVDEFRIYRRMLREREIFQVAYPEAPLVLEAAAPLQATYVAPAWEVPYSVRLRGRPSPEHVLELSVGGNTTTAPVSSEAPVFVLVEALPAGMSMTVLSLVESGRVVCSFTNQIFCTRGPFEWSAGPSAAANPVDPP